MGNCQAAEAATVVIQHPGNKIERIYWSVSAQQIMCSNPGHYVAILLTSPAAAAAAPAKQLKLLRPDDTLVIGQVYRLISFEDVLKEFAAKKSVKLGKLLKETGAIGEEEEEEKKKKKKKKKSDFSDAPDPVEEEPEILLPGRSTTGGGNLGHYRGVGRHYGNGAQWRPALQTIAEVGR